MLFLPPATRLGQCNIFRSMCQEFCPQDGACMAGGVHGRGHAWQGACMAGGVCVAGGVHGRGACMAGACVAGGAFMLPPTTRYYEIQSMSGRYASYWNAFFSSMFRESCYDERCLQRADFCPRIAHCKWNQPKLFLNKRFMSLASML